MSSLPQPLGQPWWQSLIYSTRPLYILSSPNEFKHKVMKLNSTITLTIVMLTILLGAGLASGYVGYALGSVSLEGVTQPDVDRGKPAKNSQDQKTDAKNKGLKILEEKEIIAQARQLMQPSGSNASAKAAVSKPEDTQVQEKENDDAETIGKELLPMVSAAQGVKLEVSKITEEDSSIVLEIDLKNEGSKPVKFLYSFLDVRDDQNRPLSAITEGLPGELPANSDRFTGTIKIPTALLDDAKKISLTLTDYPDRNIELQVIDVPVVK